MGRNAIREVAMANRQQPFKSHHITRALKAAIAAGSPDPKVEFHAPDGSRIVVGAGSKSVTPAISKPKVRSPAAPARRPVR
jgi:hypothetical protein